MQTLRDATILIVVILVISSVRVTPATPGAVEFLPAEASPKTQVARPGLVSPLPLSATPGSIIPAEPDGAPGDCPYSHGENGQATEEDLEDPRLLAAGQRESRDPKREA